MLSGDNDIVICSQKKKQKSQRIMQTEDVGRQTLLCRRRRNYRALANNEKNVTPKGASIILWWKNAE